MLRPVGGEIMVRIRGIVARLLMSWALAASACDKLTADEPMDGAAEAATDLIAYVGHGAIFDSSGRKLDLTPALVEQIQQSYVQAILTQANNRQRTEFEDKQRGLLAGDEWDARSKLYANAELIDWLVYEVQPADADRIAGHNKVLQGALVLEGFASDSIAAPFEPSVELRERFAQVGIGRDAGLHGVRVQNAMSAGAAYISECAAAGVPVPPSWGTSGWVSRGPLTTNFLGGAAEVFTYQSSSPAGMCIALPRKSGNTIFVLGIICLGTNSSNACFWDNQTAGSSFPIPPGTVVPLSQFLGGADLQKDVGGECTSCHAGEDPYIIHPNTALGLPNLAGLPLRSASWYRPLVRADWIQNPGPTNLFDNAGSGQCAGCHTQAGAGRFPSVSTALEGYCNTILPMAFSQTMPPGSPGSSAHLAHYAALILACLQPPPATHISPRVPTTAEVSAVGRSADKLDIFVTDQQGVIYTASWEPAFSGWWQLNGGRAAPGAPVHAVSRSQDKLDAFVIGTDANVYTAAWEPAFADGWHGWWGLNGGVAALGAHVTAVSRGPDKLDAFVVGTNGHVYTATWEPSLPDSWQGWTQIGNITVPQGAAIHGVSRSLDHIDLFATDVNGLVWTAARDLAGWHTWSQLNGGMAAPGAPVFAVSRSTDKLDVFVVGTNGHAYTAAWEPSFPDSWDGWSQVGTDIFPQGASLHAVSRSTDKIDVFGTDTSGRILTASWQPSTGWSGWGHINGGGSQPGAPVTVVSRSADKLDAFVVGTDHRVWTAAWTPGSGGWQGWWPIGQ